MQINFRTCVFTTHIHSSSRSLGSCTYVSSGWSQFTIGQTKCALCFSGLVQYQAFNNPRSLPQSLMKTAVLNDPVQEVHNAEHYFAEISLIETVTSHLFSTEV